MMPFCPHLGWPGYRVPHRGWVIAVPWKVRKPTTSTSANRHWSAASRGDPVLNDCSSAQMHGCRVYETRCSVLLRSWEASASQRLSGEGLG